MKTFGISLSVALCCYVLSYCVLSVCGGYAAAVWGLPARGPKWYRWAPAGFYDPATGEWRMKVLAFYAPLEVADNYFWHTHGNNPEATDPQYPAVFPTYK
jgi:hypothetical protein